ncbi:hypothetical protein DAKH74_030920 [Maudiozyma humilis]|uniref:t-SNARE coiled-coil homology domain-containing protein n=1 Tax=Maudiozyma humilis TaxID=51915 RepID=A0AAV5RYK3_MAUHU|nr:hypothetical protein DAKH74_030920 [Kazachstania humilis]
MALRHKIQISKKPIRKSIRINKSFASQETRKIGGKSRSSRIGKRISETHVQIHNNWKKFVLKRHLDRKGHLKSIPPRHSSSPPQRYVKQNTRLNEQYPRESFSNLQKDVNNRKVNEQFRNKENIHCELSPEADVIQTQYLNVTTDSLHSLQKSLAMAQQAESSGIRSLNMLKEQGKKMNMTEQKIHQINSYNKVAKDNIHYLASGCYPTPLESNSRDSVPKRSYSVEKRQRTSLNHSTALNRNFFVSEPCLNSALSRRQDDFCEGTISTGECNTINDSIDRTFDGLSKVIGRLNWMAKRTSEELDCQLNRLSTTENTLDCVTGNVQSNIRKMYDIT